MPIYEFHCEKCDSDSEILVRSSKWKGTKCPKCGSSNLSKKLSVFSSTVAQGGGGVSPCGLSGGDVSACAMNSGGSGGCCCAGGKHRH